MNNIMMVSGTGVGCNEGKEENCGHSSRWTEIGILRLSIGG